MIQIIRTDKRGRSYTHTFENEIDVILNLCNYIKFIQASESIQIKEVNDEA